MTIKRTEVVDTTEKAIYKASGVGNETDQIIVNAESDLTEATNETKVSLIECFYIIEGTGTLKISASSEDSDLSLTGKGKYGLKPGELKFGNDKQITLSTDSNVESYLLVAEFRRNN